MASEQSEPWATEGDSDEWTSAAGYLCRIVRHNSLRHLCGYVGVPEGHPWHGSDYDNVEPYPEVHGGLTFDGDHSPLVGPDGLWWLGFDCAHGGDLVPGTSEHRGDTYRSMAFVRAECESLAEQASEAEQSA